MEERALDFSLLWTGRDARRELPHVVVRDGAVIFVEHLDVKGCGGWYIFDSPDFVPYGFKRVRLHC
jgi:hypothetical protein